MERGGGPCLDCFRTGVAVSVPDISTSVGSWPEFREAALARGFLSVYATPLRLRGEVIGTMNLFSTTVGGMRPRDAAVAQALADVATIGILHERITARSQIVAQQLQHALDSRILIEQAKGVLAQAAMMGMDQAFSALRGYARNHNLSLHLVAAGVIDRTIDIRALQSV